MRDSKARMLGLIYLIFMTMAAGVYGFDIPEEPVIRIGSGAVQDARFSPDGRYLAVATSLGVEIRDAQTLEQLRFLPGASEPVVFNHQTTLLVTGTGTIWDTADFTKIAELPEEQSVFAFTPDDSLLIAGHWRTAVSAWDTGNWQKVRTYSSKYWGESIHGLAISPDGKLLCASFSHPIVPGQPFGGWNMGNIIIWDIESGKRIKTLVDDVIYPAAVAFSSDGAILATQIHGNIVLWETQTWGEVGKFSGGSNCYGCPYSMEFQPGTRLLACPKGYHVELWDTDAVAAVRELSGHVYIIGSVSFHPNGDLLATVSLDGDMRLWDVASGEEIEMTPYSSPVAALAFSRDSETLIYCGEKRRTERYNLVTGETGSILPAASGSYRSLDFGANGSLLAVTNSGQITIYNTDTGEVELSFGGQYNDAAFSNDDNTLVVLTGLGPGNLVVRAILRDIRTWEVVAEIPMTNIFSSKVELSNEGRILAVLASDEIQIWDVATRRVESVLTNNGGGYPVNMTLSNTGKLLAADGRFVGRGVVKVWDVDKGEILHIFDKATGAPTPLAFSQDDRILVTGGSRGEMALWDMVDGEMLRLYHEHTSKVNCLEFSPDGRYLASGGEDGLILIWEVNVDGSGDVDIKAEDIALVRWGAVKRTALFQNYPNPFNPETWIPFSLSEPKHVIIRIYTSTGRLIRTLDLGQKPSGAYLSKEKAAYWDGRNEKGELVASDVYFYVMEAGESSTFLRKMVMAR